MKLALPKALFVILAFAVVDADRIVAQEKPTTTIDEDVEEGDSNELLRLIYNPDLADPVDLENTIYKKDYWKSSLPKEFVKRYAAIIRLNSALASVINFSNPGHPDYGPLNGIIDNEKLAKDRNVSSPYNIAVVAAGRLRLESCILGLMKNVTYSVKTDDIPPGLRVDFTFFSAAESLSRISGQTTIREVMRRLKTGERSKEEVFLLTWILQQAAGEEFAPGILEASEFKTPNIKLAQRFLEAGYLSILGVPGEDLAKNVELHLGMRKPK